ncbi:unnamed protein product, partial [Mesorhabditis spiculigera]
MALPDLPFLQKVLDENVQYLRTIRASDFVDRLHHKVTPQLLALMGILVYAKSQAGSPIHCILPKELHDGGWHKYFHEYCFISTTYNYRTFHSLADVHDRVANIETGKEINYYQWVPLFLFTMIAFFFLPYLLWRRVIAVLWMDIDLILGHAKDYSTELDPEKRAALSSQIAEYIYRTNRYQAEKRGSGIGSILFQRTATLGYMFHKVLLIINVVFLLALVRYFLGIPVMSFGVEQLFTIFTRADDNMGYGVFPKVVFCKTNRIQPLGGAGHPLGYNLQCLLTLNYLNEKLLAITIANMMSWMLYLLRGLTSSHENLFEHSGRKISFHRYVDSKTLFKTLGPDGRLLFRFISMFADELTAVDIIESLIQRFRKAYKSHGTWSENLVQQTPETIELLPKAEPEPTPELPGSASSLPETPLRKRTIFTIENSPHRSASF